MAILASADIISEGLLSLQSLDEATLATIRRSNIKIEKYDALAGEFRRAHMPLFVDLMMGLPGQTVASLRSDLQQCVDREVTAKCHGTELLINSPMNDATYRTDNQVVTSRPPGATGAGADALAKLGPSLVVSTSSFTRADYEEMHRMRRTYLLSENLGVLRHVARFVRSVTGTVETDFYESLRHAATADPERWPVLAMALNAVPDSMTPPVSWALFIEELRDHLLRCTEVVAGSDLETTLAVQQAVLPSPSRSFPCEIRLGHDFAAWHDEILRLKESGHRNDWETVAPPLSTYAPASLTIQDPHDVSLRNMGLGSALTAYSDWELDSQVSRAMPHHHRLSIG